MTAPNSTNIVKRSEAQRPLTYAEMDGNLQELINVIDQNNSQGQQLTSVANAQVVDEGLIFESLRRSYAEAGYNLVDGSFKIGGVLTSSSDVMITSSGDGYSWGGPEFPHVVAQGTNPAAIGSGYVPRTDVVLRSELSANGGAGLVGLSQAGTVQDAINTVTPEMYFNVASSVTAAIQLAADNGLNIDMSGRDWEINSPITFRDGTTLNIESSNIIASTGTSPLFIYNATTGKGLTINGGSGVITGTASAFLSCTGLSATPANADYVKQVRIRGVHVSSATINKSLHFVNAVRQVFIDSCMFYTQNGVVAHGKCVEVKFTKSIIYSSGGTNTVGIQLISPGGGNWYHEGWHFTDCTIDNFENTFDVRDVFVLTINGGYIGCNSATGYALRFGGRTTTHCREICINSVIGGKIIFVSEPSGWFVNSEISGILTRVSSGVCVSVENNANGIDFRGLKFESVSGAVCAVVKNNCRNIVFSDITTDTSPVFGIQIIGATGEGCVIDGFKYNGSDSAMYLERPVFKRGVTSSTAQDASYSQRTTMIPNGTYVVGATIGAITMSISKGDRGTLMYTVSYSGADSALQNLQLTLPTGIVVPTGSGVDSSNLLLSAASGVASKVVPFYASSDVIAGVFALKNQAGNTLTARYHSTLSVVLA